MLSPFLFSFFFAFTQKSCNVYFNKAVICTEFFNSIICVFYKLETILVNNSVASRLNMITEHDLMICQVSIYPYSEIIKCLSMSYQP